MLPSSYDNFFSTLICFISNESQTQELPLICSWMFVKSYIDG